MISSRANKGFTREELAALSPWRLPVMDEPEPEPEPPPEEPAEELPRMPTAEEIEAIQKQAYDEAAEAGHKEGFERGHSAGREQGFKEGHEQGFKEGREQGLKEGHAEGHAQGHEQGHAAGWQAGYAAGQAVMLDAAARFEPLADCLAEPLAQLDEQVEQELVALCIAIAKQLIRRELRTDPGQIVAVAREALGVLPAAARRVSLHLHPEDAELVRDALTLRESGPRWKIMEDPLLSRGGCRVVSETSQIDATVEKRLMAVIAHLLGGGREGDAP